MIFAFSDQGHPQKKKTVFMTVSALAKILERNLKHKSEATCFGELAWCLRIKHKH